MVMECNYGGGLFLGFQPVTDCMFCEGVGRPYCRLYYSLWGLDGLSAGWCTVSQKPFSNMAASELLIRDWDIRACYEWRNRSDV